MKLACATVLSQQVLAMLQILIQLNTIGALNHANVNVPHILKTVRLIDQNSGLQTTVNAFVLQLLV
jgi:hypothetical protein